MASLGNADPPSSLTAFREVMNGLLSTKPKCELVSIVELFLNKQGVHGTWRDFLGVYDPQYAQLVPFPDVRRKEDIIAFLETLNKVEDLQELALYLNPTRELVYDLRQTLPNESAEQRLVRMTLSHHDYCFDYLPPFHKIQPGDWALTGQNRIGARSQYPTTHEMIALSTETIICEDGTEVVADEKKKRIEVVARVVAVNRDSKVILDRLVKPNQRVVDYKTATTNLTARRLENSETVSVADIHLQLKKLFSVDTIMVGHCLNRDLKALRIHHVRVIDTSLVFKYQNDSRRPCLRYLTEANVVDMNAPTNCVQRAKAAMKLVCAILDNRVETTIPEETLEVKQNPQLLKRKRT